MNSMKTDKELLRQIKALNALVEAERRDATLVIRDWNLFSKKNEEIDQMYLEELKKIFKEIKK